MVPIEGHDRIHKLCRIKDLHTSTCIASTRCSMGPSRLRGCFERCKKLGMNAVAVTDHGNMFGAVEFYTKAKAAEIKPIIGIEAYIAPGSRFDRTKTSISDAAYHLILLAENNAGYRNLLKLASTGYRRRVLLSAANRQGDPGPVQRRAHLCHRLSQGRSHGGRASGGHEGGQAGGRELPEDLRAAAVLHRDPKPPGRPARTPPRPDRPGERAGRRPGRDQRRAFSRTRGLRGPQLSCAPSARASWRTTRTG